jgi:hypothetical protein
VDVPGLVRRRVGLTDNEEVKAMSKNQSNSVKNFGDIEILFRKAAPVEPVKESHCPGFDQRLYTLPKGYVHREGNSPLVCDIFVEQDVAVKLRDGVTIYVDIYRPADQDNCPAIIGWSPYGKCGGFLSMGR